MKNKLFKERTMFDLAVDGLNEMFDYTWFKLIIPAIEFLLFIMIITFFITLTTGVAVIFEVVDMPTVLKFIQPY